jgi:hypothetical protein
MASTINGTSTGNGGLISTGDDSGILNIQTNETTAITVDASQNVGIGTTSPTALTSNKALTINSPTGFGSLLDLKTNETLNLRVFSNASNSGLSVKTATPLLFDTNDTERMRIDSSGNVGIGSSTITSADGSAGRILKVSGATNTVLVGETTGNGGFNALILEARNSNRTNARFAQIQMQTTSTATDGGLISFSTSATGTGTDITERMRIDSNGNLNVNRQITSFTTNGFGVFASTNIVTIADSSTITLSSGSSSQLISLTCASTGTGGAFFANYNTTVSQIGGSSTSISTTDAGTVDIAIYKSANSNTVTFKNRSGASRVYRIAMFCGENGGTV